MIMNYINIFFNSISNLFLLFSLAVVPAISMAAEPAQRIISLAPHLTEMVYSSGAGDKLVGVVNYSDYPPKALQLPIIGSYHALDLEAIIALKPDLILSWQSGNRIQDIERLKALGFNLFESDIHDLNDIPNLIETIGGLAGTLNQANAKASDLRQTLLKLRRQYQDQEAITVFYQIWNRPFITMGKKQFISQGLELCGAKNIFNDLRSLTAEVSLEAILARDPQVILIGGQKAFQKDWRKTWNAYSSLRAVKNNQIQLLENNLYQRPTERFIYALEPLCKRLDKARQVYTHRL